MADRSLGGVDEEVDEPVAASGGNRSVTLHPDVTKWRVTDVLQWLDSRGLGRFAAQFKDNDVTGAAAPTRSPARDHCAAPSDMSCGACLLPLQTRFENEGCEPHYRILTP